MSEDDWKKVESQAEQPPIQPNQPTNESQNPTDTLITESKIIPTKIEPGADEKQHRTAEQDYWKRQLCLAKALNWITLFTAIVAVGGLIFLKATLDATQNAAEAAKLQAQAALDQLHSQRPYVSLGRADGTIAEYRSPSEGRSKGSIFLYFQNTGPIAATYFLINLGSFFNPDARINERHVERWKNFYNEKPFGRSYTGGVTLGADSTHVEILNPKLVPTTEEWEMIEADQMEHGFSLWGNLEYCDPWGTFHCEEFNVRYKPDPVRRFVSSFNTECSGWPRPFDPKTHASGTEYRTEGMPRCEQPEERITREKQLQ